MHYLILNVRHSVKQIQPWMIGAEFINLSFIAVSPQILQMCGGGSKIAPSHCQDIAYTAACNCRTSCDRNDCSICEN